MFFNSVFLLLLKNSSKFRLFFKLLNQLFILFFKSLLLDDSVPPDTPSLICSYVKTHLSFVPFPWFDSWPFVYS